MLRAIVFLLLMASPSWAADIDLIWNCNKGSEILGYKIYQGDSSKNYRSVLTTVAPQCDVDQKVHFRVTDLTCGTFYWAVSAINANGESPASDEVTTRITGNCEVAESSQKSQLPASPTGLAIGAK
jgi:hypothetical protein